MIFKFFKNKKEFIQNFIFQLGCLLNIEKKTALIYFLSLMLNASKFSFCSNIKNERCVFV